MIFEHLLIDFIDRLLERVGYDELAIAAAMLVLVEKRAVDGTFDLEIGASTSEVAFIIVLTQLFHLVDHVFHRSLQAFITFALYLFELFVEVFAAKGLQERDKVDIDVVAIRAARTLFAHVQIADAGLGRRFYCAKKEKQLINTIHN